MANALRKAFVVAGGGYGDEGKGSIVDFLTKQYKAHTIVRYNGGAQAAHNVVTPDGRHHTFAQFGSGMFHPDVMTYLSRYMLVNPFLMLTEALHLDQLGVADVLARTYVDGDALVITPFHVAANRLIELSRGAARYGSCGLGIGQTMEDYLMHGEKMLCVKDLADGATTKKKLTFVRDLKHESLREILASGAYDTMMESLLFEGHEYIERCARRYVEFAQKINIVSVGFLKERCRDGVVIFEGAQGALLDTHYGFHPYTTRTDISFHNAEQLLNDIEYDGERSRIAVLRAYMTRHGAGPFVTEDKDMTATLLEPHNCNGKWQGAFRVGHFDLAATKYALDILGHVDMLALTHVDRLMNYAINAMPLRLCYGYNMPELDKDYFVYDRAQRARIIRKTSIPDTEHQHVLAQHLAKAKPLYTYISPEDSTGRVIDKCIAEAVSGTNRYIDEIVGYLKIPLGIHSGGPTSCEKHLFIT